ncbi:MAG: DUF4192 domain-containing protein [Corynebacterium sp.]|nr:DUF4192 domain-containing protein [Corynebacterium sp.]
MTHNLSSPATVIANIPGLLGFYPDESLVVMTFEPSKATANTFDLDYIARIDLDDEAGRHAAFSLIGERGPALVWVFLVSEDHRSDSFAALVDTITTDAHECGVTIDAGWSLGPIATGAAYRLVIASDAVAAHAPVQQGYVSDIATAYSTRAYEESGETVYASRAAVFNNFAYGNANNHQSEVRHRHIEADANELARSIRHGTGYYAAVEQFEDLIVAITIDGDRRHTVGLNSIMGSKRILPALAVFFGAKTPRDLVMTFIPTYPEAVRDISLAVARSYHGFIRENALCIYALAMIQLGAVHMSVPAVRVALSENPGHQLADILSQGFFAGLYSQLLASCLEGAMGLQQNSLKTRARQRELKLAS